MHKIRSEYIKLPTIGFTWFPLLNAKYLQDFQKIKLSPIFIDPSISIYLTKWRTCDFITKT